MLYLCDMKNIVISESLFKRVLIEGEMDEEYYNIMVDEIDNHYGHVLVMKDKVREAIGEFQTMMVEIMESDISDEYKDKLKSKILDIFTEGDIYKI